MVAEQDECDAAHQRSADLQEGYRRRRGDEAGTPSLPVATPEGQAEHRDEHEHEDPTRERADVGARDVVDRVVLDRDRPAFAEDLQEYPLPEEEAGERDDERGQTDPRDDRSLEHADSRAGEERGRNCRIPGPAVGRAREVGHDHPAEAGDEPDREVDLAEEQDEDLPHRQQAEDRSLDEQVDEVAGGQELVVEGLEQDRDQDHPCDDRQDPALAGLEPRERGSEVLADGVSRDLGRNCELGLASRLLRLNVRLGRPGGLVDLGHQAPSPFLASRSDLPVVIRSTAICRSSSDAGRCATT